jgi:hypothetical protein
MLQNNLLYKEIQDFLEVFYLYLEDFIMRTEMRESTAQLEEKRQRNLSERHQYGDRCFEKWLKTKQIGTGLDALYNENAEKARGVSMILEAQESHLATLTETQISNAFKTTPHNVIRIVRLGYPNSIRGEVFTEWPMETARDALYYLRAVHATSRRGATKDKPVIETFEGQYPSEKENHTIGTGNAVLKAFTNTVTYKPIVPYTTTVFVGTVPVARDDGTGNVLGALLDTAAANTINYETGVVTLNFLAAPASGAVISVEYSFDSEVADRFDDVGETQLQLKDYQFRVRPWPLFISWSKMTELLLGTTLNIDAEEALISGAGDELKKALDYFALRAGYKEASAHTAVQFNTQGAVGEAEIDRAQAFTRSIGDAGDTIFDLIGRGGVTVMYGGPKAVEYAKLHSRFTPAGRQPPVGAHRVGEIDGIGIYKAPSAICPTDEFVGVFKNPENEADTAMVVGSLIPLYKTDTLEYRNMTSETGVGFFGDIKVLNPEYFTRIKLLNL